VLLLLFGAAGLTVSSNAVILRLALGRWAAAAAAERVQGGRPGRPGPVAAGGPRPGAADPHVQRDAGQRRGVPAAAARDRGAGAGATEEERKRIARELHDGTAQTLAALRVRLRVARALQDDAERSALLERISADLGEATEEIRRIARG
jgi:signal transduction histidine kinase